MPGRCSRERDLRLIWLSLRRGADAQSNDLGRQTVAEVGAKVVTQSVNSEKRLRIVTNCTAFCDLRPSESRPTGDLCGDVGEIRHRAL